MACEISTGDELLLTEMVFNGLFNELTGRYFSHFFTSLSLSLSLPLSLAPSLSLFFPPSRRCSGPKRCAAQLSCASRESRFGAAEGGPGRALSHAAGELAFSRDLLRFGFYIFLLVLFCILKNGAFCLLCRRSRRVALQKCARNAKWPLRRKNMSRFCML